MPSLSEIMEAQNRNCGAGTVAWGHMMKKDPPRIPTGVFPVDLVVGGGLPVWGSTCFWGKESGGKTSLALDVLATAQHICWGCYNHHTLCTCSTSPIRMKGYWGDVEGTLDRDWAENVGVDPDTYAVGLADYGEQHINVADSALQADDVGIVIIDSLAAMVPSAEMEAQEEQQFMGLQARMITRMVRKLKQRLIKERKNDHPCALLFINQLRTKIGVMFGDPETMPGGHGMMHEFSLLLRIVQKSLVKDGVDKKYTTSGKAEKFLASRHAFAVRKAKLLTLRLNGEFVRATADIPELGLHAGQVEDTAVLLNYAKEFDIVRKNTGSGKPWLYFDHPADKLDTIREVWRRRPGERLRTSKAIVSKIKETLIDSTCRDTHDTEDDEA